MELSLQIRNGVKGLPFSRKKAGGFKDGRFCLDSNSGFAIQTMHQGGSDIDGE